MRALAAALSTAAILVVLAPERDAGAKDQLPPSTVPVVDVIVRFSPQVDADGRRAVVRSAGGTIDHDPGLVDGLGARMPSSAVEPLRSALGVVSIARATG